MKYTFTGISGFCQGMTWLIETSLTVGRDSANTVPIDEPSVSRRHCSIEKGESGFLLADLGSSNGTFVNGLPVTERVLDEGDEIRVGRSVFRFGPGEEQSEWAMSSSVSVGRTMMLRLEDSVYHQPAAVRESAGRARSSLETLLQFMTSLSVARALPELAKHTVDAMRSATGAGRGAMLLREDRSGDWRCAAETDEGITIAETVACEVLGKEAGLLSNDVAVCDGGGQADPVSILAVPLRGFSGVFGLIYLDTPNREHPFDAEHLQLATAMAAAAGPPLDNALRIELLERENQRLQEAIRIEHDMVGDSARMRATYAFVAKTAPTQATVLIRGESGTGKELVARAIHRNSPRTRGPFVAINCAALTESLLESELFGHEKGAFTGAVAQKRGRIEEASGGTLFLDEIGELAAPMQAKLLRVIQEREFERVGGTKPIRADIRLIAATHRDLEAMVKSGAFRQDLYYRLNVVGVTMPALRERREDIGILAEFFIRKHGRGIGRRLIGLSPAAKARLNQYDWPGNVRELENAIERALVLGASEYVEPDDLPECIAELGEASPSDGAADDFHEQVRAAKRQIVIRALDQSGRDYNEAARRLGLHPSNLYRLVRNLDLKNDLG